MRAYNNIQNLTAIGLALLSVYCKGMFDTATSPCRVLIFLTKSNYALKFIDGDMR